MGYIPKYQSTTRLELFRYIPT